MKGNNLEPRLLLEKAMAPHSSILAWRIPMDGGAWWATVHGVAESWTRLSEARREWQDILKVMKENNLQPRLLYPARISFKYEGEIKSFSDKQKLREFCTTKPALQQILKDIL